MKTIWKYILETTDLQKIKMPIGAKILTVQIQHGVPCIWCLVNPDEDVEYKIIRTIGTGHDLENDFSGKYLGTYRLDSWHLTVHVFEC